MTRTSTRAHHRPTITDVARAAGVSTAVVSYALNDRPGVSAATRERVLRVADEFGWRPSVAARSVRCGTRTVGLVVTCRPGTLAAEAHFLEFVTAATEVVAAEGLSLAVHVAAPGEDPAQTYREWWAERRFTLMVVPDVRTDDERVATLRQLGAPGVVLAPAATGEGLGCVTFDEEQVAERIISAAVELGHRTVAAVTGPMDLRRTQVRVAALRTAAARFEVRLAHRATDASVEAVAAATHALLTAPEQPSLIAYDTDTGALAALDVARRCGLSVPWDVSIIAIGDSGLCRLAMPPITVLPLPMAALGAAVGQGVLAVLAGDPDHRVVVPVGGLVLRGSTSPHVPVGARNG